MNKKLIVVLCLFVAGAVSGGVFFNFFKSDEEISFERFIPKTNVLYIKQDNFKELIANFSTTPLGKKLASIDYAEIAKKTGSHDEDVQKLRDIKKVIGDVLDNPLFNELFGESFSISLAPVSEATIKSDGIQKALEESVVVIAKPSHGTKVLDSLTSILPAYIEIITEKYQGYKIKALVIDDNNTVYAAVVNDVVLLGISDKQIKHGLDVFKGNSATLLNHEKYLQLKTKVGEQQLLSFVQVKPLNKTLTTIFKGLPPDEFKTIGNMLQELNNYKYLISGTNEADKTITAKSIVAINEQVLSPHLKAILMTEPEVAKGLDKLPEELLGYYWTNTFKPEEMYGFALDKYGVNKQQQKSIEEQFSYFFGMSKDEFFSLFDNKLIWLAKESNGHQFLPLPDFAFYVDIHEPERLHKLVEYVIKQNKLAVHEREYNGITLTLWGPALQKGFQPIITVFENKLVVSSGLSIMKEVLDGFNGEKNFIENHSVAAVTKEFKKNSNTACYLQMASLNRLVKEVVSWGGTILAIQDRNAALKTKILIDELIHPLMDGLSMYSDIGYRTYLQKTDIYMDLNVYVDKKEE